MTIPAVPPQIGSIIGHSFLYGGYSLLLPVCIYTLFADRHATPSPFIKLLLMSVVLYLISTVAWIFHILYVIRGFVTDRDNLGPERFFLNPQEPYLIVQIGLYILQMLIADCIWIWRLYIVWDRKPRICIIPFICWLVAAASGMFLVIKLSTLEPTDLVLMVDLGEEIFITLGYCTTVILNTFCTVMISMRIGISCSGVNPVPSAFSRLIRIIVESFLVYTILTLATMIFYLVGELNIMLLLISYTGPVAGLSFCLFIIRRSLLRN